MRAIRAMMVMAFLAAAAGQAGAELCPNCKGKSYIKNLGQCVECESITTSGAFKLCMKCSRKLNQCEHCRAPLAADKPLEYGNHTSGKWEYRYSIANKGTRSEGTFGKLLYDGKELPDGGAINDHYSTPWGILFWAGNRPVAFGAHGWMPRPAAHRGPGRLLADPSGAAVTLVWVKVLTPGRADDQARAEPEPWVLEELKKLGVESAGVDRDWFVLGGAPVTIHDTKLYGRAVITLEDKQGQGLTILSSTTHKAELARRQDARTVLKCPLKSVMGTLDLYVVAHVETAGPQEKN